MRARIILLSIVLAVLISVEACSGCSRKSAETPENHAESKAISSTQVTNAAERAESAANIPADQSAIVAAVRQNIESDPKIRSKQIQVSYEHGIVRLRGKVGDLNDIQSAGNDALKADGIQGVANCLTAEKYLWGSPARPLPSHEAEIDSMLQAILSDPSIKGRIEVTFVPSDPALKGEEGSFDVRGSVEDVDGEIAINNHMRKLTDLYHGSSVTVLHDPYDPLHWSPTDTSPPPPWNGPSQPDKASIPLCRGLTVVTSVAGPDGDYESIKTIESVDSSQVRLKYSAEVMQSWLGTREPKLIKTVTHRNVLTGDVESAHNYDFNFSEKAPDTAPGSTAIGTSATLLKELKTKGESELGLCGGDDDLPIRDKDGHVHPLTAGCSVFFSRTLKRVENEPVLLRVLVNGVPTDLPAVHAMAEWGGGASARNEFFFLDDERNPLTIKFRMDIGGVPALTPHERVLCENARKNLPTDGTYFVGFSGDDPPSCDLPDGGDRDTLRVVKITTDCSTPGTATAGGSAASGTGVATLEQSLAQTGKVDIYSIYFSFNSNLVRDESEPTLKEIAEVLRRHPDWRLRIAGHTDGIGGDQQNLDLSKRRAVAVKDALVKKYGIATGRLETTGFGKSQPKDTNDTLEGRAHNRRVELMKIS